MGLDKWIKKDDDEKKESVSKKKKEDISKEANKLKKFSLKCSKSKCNYQKTLMKRSLSQKDKICPRCKSEMKIKVK
ncbi:MAG: hypothetical protein GF317_22465 [Candidatus Lokiarchaeota archaeon]|nr:hypothetical protein [Candidatus Lokiarchaeota archaeon]MBD3202225.1 hypothetical protein [Candidatus Lokiarchaeota archaeon]